MAISWVESQVFEGSTATRGVRDRRRGVVVRRGVLQGLDDTIASYNAGLDFAQLRWASFDPIEGLPRQTITLKKISGDKAIVEARYSLTSGLDIDNGHAMERADAAMGTVSVQWYSKHKTYSASNYPSTEWAGGITMRTTRPMKVIQFTPHMTYGSTPLIASIRNMQNKINNSTFSLGGINWPQHTVRFDGFQLDVKRLGSYTLYDTRWSLSVREDRWRQENVSEDLTEIETDLMYDTASFSIPTNWTP